MKLTTTTPATTQLDPDELSVSFKYADGHRSAIPYYDDGFGPLWILRDSIGIVGIVRCQSETDAYGIAEDEFFPVVAPEDEHEAYGAYDRLRDYLISQGHEDTYALREFAIRYAPAYFAIVAAGDDPPELIEGYSYAPNGPRDVGGTGIVSHDMNGEALDPLTPKLIERLEIEMIVDFHKKPRNQ